MNKIPCRKWMPIVLGTPVAMMIMTGCATVQPWERGQLADYTMQLDKDPLSITFAEHMWFSREAASGGSGVGGGGCGCN